MTYKGHLIEAEVRTYESWSLDDNGNLDEYQFGAENSIDDDDIKYEVSDDSGDWREYFDTLDAAKAFIDKRS
jgi:hypothetical protein